MKNKSHPRFVKCYLNLGRLFDPAEMIFILQMQQVEFLRKMDCNSRWSKRFLMKKMNLGEKVFDRCARHLSALELLHVSTAYHPAYRWNEALYDRLVEILSATDNIDALDEFCCRVFEVEKRSIRSVSDSEIEELSGKSEMSPKSNDNHPQKAVI